MTRGARLLSNMNCACAAPGNTISSFGSGALAKCLRRPGNRSPAALASSRGRDVELARDQLFIGRPGRGAEQHEPVYRPWLLDGGRRRRHTAEAAANDRDRGSAFLPEVVHRSENVQLVARLRGRVSWRLAEAAEVDGQHPEASAQ